MLYSFTRKLTQNRPHILKIVRFILFAGRLGPWRNMIMKGIRKFFPNPVLLQRDETIFPKINTSEVVDQINEFGYSTGFCLPEVYTEKILDFYLNRQKNPIENPHFDCQWINNIALDPIIIEIARKYLGIEPILYKTSIYCSLPSSFPKGKRSFHFDVGDFKGLTLFIYLTDVDFDCSPHILIEKTHRKGFKDLLYQHLSYEKAEKKYKERVKIITGRRGTILLEDLTTYHQRSFGRKERIVLTISYLFKRKPNDKMFKTINQGLYD